MRSRICCARTVDLIELWFASRVPRYVPPGARELEQTELTLVRDIGNGTGAGRELVLAQQLARSEEALTEHFASGVVDWADSRHTIEVVHREDGIAVDVRVVQQVRTVAGDDRLGVVRVL